MSNPLTRAEHYRYLESEHRRLASNDPSAETRNYHLLMAKNYSRLAEAVGAQENTRNRGPGLVVTLTGLT
jgi:hypothetical protein